MGAATSVLLVGRELEREALERWLRAVRRGGAGCAVLEGEAGIGKTTLTDAACVSAAALSFEVFRGGADEFDRGVPLGTLGEVLGVAPGVADGPVAAPGAEYRLVDRLVERVEAQALQGPVAVVAEDLQWADLGTVVGLRTVSRRLSHLPVAVLATVRPWPRSAELERLIDAWRDEGALHLALEPLDHVAVLELAATLVGAPPGPALERQLSAAAGNPLFVRELVGALSEDRAIQLADGVAELHGESLPPSLRLTILRRLGALGDATLWLLRVASTLGTTFSVADLSTVCGRPAAAVVQGLLEARRAGVVEETGDQLRFRHDLVRDALYGDLPESARRALHRDAGRLLAQAGAPRVQVAEQLSLGAAAGDREAVRWLWDAARDMVLRAPQTAVGLLERAVEIADPGDPMRDESIADLADALVWSGRPGDARAMAEDLLSRGVPVPVRDRARSTLVRALWMEGRWRQLVARVDRWLEAAPPMDAQRGPLLADLAMACVFSGDTTRAESLALEALAIGEALGDDGIVFRALYALSPIYNFRGEYDAELAASERGLGITERGENPDLVRFHPHFALAMSLNSHDRYEEAEQTFNTGLRVREELGTVWDLPLYQAGLADLHCQMGGWDDALAEAETGTSIAEEVGTRIGVVVCASVAALIQAHRDELEDAERHLAVAQREVDRSGPQWGTYWLILATAQIQEAAGDEKAALASLSEGWDRHAHSPGLQVYLGPELVRLALMHDPDRAHAVADAVASRAEKMSIASAEGSALLCRGRVDRDPRVLERAVAAFRSSGWRQELATACEATAIAQAQGGDRETARANFEEALELYGRMDARRDIARALGAMRACGIRRGSRATHRRALKGWESLTATESDIVRLTVEGLTNRQIGERLFISRRTVQTHLSHAFTKLEVTSRVELAAAAARRPPAQG